MLPILKFAIALQKNQEIFPNPPILPIDGNVIYIIITLSKILSCFPMNPRPVKKPEDRQTELIQFSCTKKEKAEIQALAKQHGINQYTVFVRLASLGRIQVNRSLIEKKK
jgi:hypothetical protein